LIKLFISEQIHGPIDDKLLLVDHRVLVTRVPYTSGELEPLVNAYVFVGQLIKKVLNLRKQSFVKLIV
jgi:hypothetical protein